jgi:hypothetical protein
MFGSLPAGPSMRLQHEQLHLQALAFVNCGKLRGAGSANLRRAPEVNATVTVQELFYPPWKNLFAVPTLCIQNGRFILNCSMWFIHYIFDTLTIWISRHSL